MPLKIFLTAQYDRIPELRTVREELTERGYEVTSRWIDRCEGYEPEEYYQRHVTTHPDMLRQFAAEDRDDVKRSHVLVSFSNTEDTTRQGAGGRHADYGMAAAFGKRLIVVGDREIVLHCLVEAHQCQPDELVGVLNSIDQLDLGD